MPYGGETFSAADIKQHYPGDTLAPYAEEISVNRFADAACVRGIGSMANGMAYREDSNVVTHARTLKGARAVAPRHPRHPRGRRDPQPLWKGLL